MKLQSKSNPAPFAGFKLVLLGNVNVGKTALISRFVTGGFSEKHTPTSGANFLSKTVISATGRTVKLQIWDVSGDPKFYGMVKAYWVGCSCIVGIYDPTDKNSLKIVESWFQKIQQEDPRIQVFALAGTKCDIPKEKRQIQMIEVLQFVKRYGIDIYFETSSKENHQIDNFFQEVAESLLQRFPYQYNNLL